MAQDEPKIASYIIGGGFLLVCALLLPALLWIGSNAAQIPSLKTSIESLQKDMTDGFNWQARKLDDHETRLRANDSKLGTLENRVGTLEAQGRGKPR